MVLTAGLALGKVRLHLDQKRGLLALLCISIYIFAVVQDLIFSKLYETGFYWSETLLYNFYWFLFPPLLLLVNRLFLLENGRPGFIKVVCSLLLGCIFTVIHIVLFALIFVGLSMLMNDNPHSLSVILTSAFSNQLYITVLAYSFLPWVYPYLMERKSPLEKTSDQYTLGTLSVKKGSRTEVITVHNITAIVTDKPYSALFVNGRKFLLNESLKKLGDSLDPEIFIRVHRSAIINKRHIREFRSRGTGDYDVELADGSIIRLSRHYRSNWEELIHHSA